jgi:two-component sensor histidine kinase
MDLAKELVRQQLFFRRELSERVGWFIGLRWIAAAAAAAGAAAAYFLRLELPLAPIVVVVAAIGIYNLAFTLICRRLRLDPHPREKRFEICAHGQIVCDLSALFALISMTGGFYSPLALFILFHIILAGILLDPVYAYIYSGIAIVGLGALGFLQSPIPPPALDLFGRLPAAPGLPRDRLFHFVLLAAVMLVTAFLVTTIKRSLRVKGRTLLVFCKELDAANLKLTALYDMVRQMALCTEFQTLMDSATRNTARIMGVKACSIKLPDEQSKVLRFASTFGLSQDYLTHGDIEIARSPINQNIMNGAVYSIGSIEAQDYFQYPENIRKEGIASMICLPLKVEKRVLGVFCVYSQARFYFAERDASFFALIAELTALAMQNLKSELNKAWFLQKAAHQLRSPLNAVDTILKVLLESYAGPLNPGQSEMLMTCERRIGSLSSMIQDLLELGLRRADSAPAILRPIDFAAFLARSAEVFRSQAEEKKIDLTFSIDADLPPVSGEERLLDDLCTNLLSNAVKYTPPGQSIRVMLHREDPARLCLQVIDTGIGIPQEQLPQLFTEFFRADNAKAFTGQGTGLGMVIVKEAVDRLHGTIVVESRENKGTRVICRLPIANSGPEQCAPEAGNRIEERSD